MGLPTREQLKSLPKISFPAGNEIPYGEDFTFYVGIPEGDWWISGTHNDFVSLVREGSGIRENYGCGSIHVATKHLIPTSQTY